VAHAGAEKSKNSSMLIWLLSRSVSGGRLWQQAISAVHSSIRQFRSSAITQLPDYSIARLRNSKKRGPLLTRPSLSGATRQFYGAVSNLNEHAPVVG
jgi:hypothetical protein